MWKMIVRRFLILIPQLLFISVFVFILATQMPGDALSGLVDPSVDEARIILERERLGLNDPWHVRYFRWMFGQRQEVGVYDRAGYPVLDENGEQEMRYRTTGGIIRGDFGRSFRHRLPVTELIAYRAMNTFWLMLVTLILTYLIAIPLGVIAGRYKGTAIDRAVMVYIFVALSIPTILMGILNIWLFSFNLGWFPRGGSVNAIVVATGTWWDILVNRLHHMVLPAVAGALMGTVGIIFMLRANIIDRTYSEYVTLARSKGVPSGTIFRRHVLRNSLIPVTAGIGFAVVGLLGGSVFIEGVFTYPGVGTLFLSSIGQRDFAVVNAIILMFSALSAAGMLISDIALMIVDPRIRIE